MAGDFNFGPDGEGRLSLTAPGQVLRSNKVPGTFHAEAWTELIQSLVELECKEIMTHICPANGSMSKLDRFFCGGLPMEVARNPPIVTQIMTPEKCQALGYSDHAPNGVIFRSTCPTPKAMQPTDMTLAMLEARSVLGGGGRHEKED